MTQIGSFAATGADTGRALDDLEAQVAAAGLSPGFVALFYGCCHDDRRIADRIARSWPQAALIGGTSCTGVMTQDGVFGADAIGMLVVDDPAGDYGTAAGDLGAEPQEAAAAILKQALDDAGCPDELPELVWIYQAPGQEEAVIAGLRSVVGDRCPILGGSSADDAVAGQWRQMSHGQVLRNGLAVAVLFPSAGTSHAFQGGYQPTGAHGTVTAVGDPEPGCRQPGSRRILTIDDQPAAEIYNVWTGNRIAGRLRTGGNILAETTNCPLGIEAGRIDGMSQYLLVHPDSVAPDGSITTFARIEAGARIHAMTGDRRRLVERAGRVAVAAAAGLSGNGKGLAGSLLVYCAGCKIAVGDRMDDVVAEIRAGVGDRPFIGCFTFGEQGSLFDRNVHANLMISAVAFGR
ncbi:FIST signal transduction protein [Marinibaculum pumilum]|uniref:FIST signal transduction protein n=1 Tax=Marinibaculum pumilum TaxID=1766165 RepID=A0ABV7L0X8_9PROT